MKDAAARIGLTAAVALALTLGGIQPAFADAVTIIPVPALPANSFVCDPVTRTATVTVPEAGPGYVWEIAEKTQVMQPGGVWNVVTHTVTTSQTYTLLPSWWGTKATNTSEPDTDVYGLTLYTRVLDGYGFPSADGDPANYALENDYFDVSPQQGDFDCLLPHPDAALAASRVSTASHARVQFVVDMNIPGATVTVKQGAKTLGTAVVDAAKKTVFMPRLSAGKHPLTVYYTGKNGRTKVKTVTLTVIQH